MFYFLLHPNVAVLRFSPDGKYFAASSRTHEQIVIDLTTLKKISVPGSIHTLMDYSFTFSGPGRMVGVNTSSPQKSILAEFPSGRVIDHLPLGDGDIVAASNPDILLIRPAADHAVGAYDLKQKKFVISNRTAAFDAWGDVMASERLNGEVGLYKRGKYEDRCRLKAAARPPWRLTSFLRVARFEVPCLLRAHAQCRLES